MIKAFLFGKFLPFHKGHEAMIRFALAHCDFLSVLVCCSEKETIPSFKRKRWIEESLSDVPNLEVLSFDYLESEFPNSSVSSVEVSRIWAAYFKRRFSNHSLLVSSEPYGEFVAEAMQIKHIPFDPKRMQVPISATAIKKDLFSNWHFLSNAVKKDLALKVVILGTESTGKTTLTEKLAKHYGCTYVLEAGRDLIPDSKNFGFSDLYLVAQEHARRIEEAVLGNSPLVLIDTDIHTTISYAEFVFNQQLQNIEPFYATNKAQLYLYLNNDVAFTQDGTRLWEEQRNLLDQSHRKILAAHQIVINEIDGNWEQRFEKAKLKVNLLLENIIY